MLQVGNVEYKVQALKLYQDISKGAALKSNLSHCYVQFIVRKYQHPQLSAIISKN